MRIYLIVSMFFIMLNSLYSQELTPQEQAVEDAAFQNISTGNYQKAGEEFSQLLSVYRKSATYNFYYGVCLVEQNKNIDEALKYIKYAERSGLGEDDAIELDYYLGRVYHLNYNFDKALEYYQKFKQELGNDAIKLYDIDKEIRMAKNGRELIQYISDLVVVENKKISKDNYYYSYKLNNFGGKLIVKPQEYKTKADIKSGKKQLMFLSDSGIVYYSSYGKKSKTLDIYQRIKQENGEWGEPELLSDIINTEYDDAYPYLHSDGKTLYFSSVGHNSMGGYDIFKSEFDSAKSQWGEPVNMDFPTNTPYDDYLYISDADDEFAYFASNRETNGDKISVYKILIDKDPIKRKVEDIDEVKSKSLLQVSPLALVDETKAKNSGYKDGKANGDGKNNLDNAQNYNFERLSVEDVVSTEEAVKIAEEDKNKQEIVVVESKDNTDNALLYSYTKYQEAEELKNEAAKLLAQSNLSETDKQRAKAMKNEAKQKEEEAVLAYNVYNNINSNLSQRKVETQETQNVVVKVKSSASVAESVEIINKNRENIAKNNEKYFEINKEILKRKEELAIIKPQKKEIEPSVLSLKKEIDDNTKQIKNLVSENKSQEASSLKNKNKELINTYKEAISKQEELTYKQKKLENEIEFLSSIAENRSIVGKTELTEKTKNINVQDYATQIDAKSLELDVLNKLVVEDAVDKQTDELLAEMNNTEQVETIAENNDETIAENNDETIVENNDETIVENTNEDIGDNNETIAENTSENADNNNETIVDANSNNSDIEDDAGNNTSIKNNTNNKTEIVVSSKEKSTITPTIIVTKKIAKSDYKNQEAQVVVTEINNNQGIVDSLNRIILVKKEQVSKETNETNKQALSQEISELEMIVELKTNKNKQLLAKANKLEANDAPTETNALATTNAKDNNLEKITTQNAEITTLYNRVNKNIVLSDSLTALAKEKQTAANITTDNSKKEVLTNEAEDLKQLAVIKKKENEQLNTEIIKKEEEIKTLALNTQTVFKEEKQFPFENTNNSPELNAYMKETFKQKYYENKNKDLEKKKQAFVETKKNVQSENSKVEIDNEINKIDAKIEENKQLAVVAKIKADDLQKNIVETNKTNISDEELYAQASSYEIKHTSKLNTKEKQNISFVDDDKKAADKSFNEYKLIEKEIEELKQSKGEDQAENKKINAEIKQKQLEADKQFDIANNIYKDANFVEYQNLDNIISKHYNKNVPNINQANQLRNEAQAYYIQANAIRTSTDDKNELEKATNYEKVAINKQKQVLDIYLATQTPDNIADNTNNNSLTTSLEDEEDYSKYSKISYKSEKAIKENTLELNDIEKEIERINNQYSESNKKDLPKLEKDRVELKQNIVAALIEMEKADSLKYNMYNNKVKELNNTQTVTERHKQSANQYVKTAEYFYSNASILRKEADTEQNLDKKLLKLQKAKEFENIAMSNQETAVNIMIDNTDDVFVSSGNLIKIDPLLSANKEVSTENIKKATTNKILENIKLTEDELLDIDDIAEIEIQVDDIDNQIEEKKAEIEEYKKSIILTDDEKTNKKTQKKIDKLEKEIFSLKYSKTEILELANDNKYYTYKNHIRNVRLKDQSEKARQGNQLAKDADKYYKRAKTLRNKSEITEDTKKSYALLLEANELEIEGIDAMERSYSVYLDIQPEDITKNLTDNNDNKTEDDIHKDIVEVKPADITAHTNTETLTNNTNEVADNKAETNDDTVKLVADNNNSTTNETIKTTDDNTSNIAENTSANTESTSVKTENTSTKTENTSANTENTKTENVDNNVELEIVDVNDPTNSATNNKLATNNNVEISNNISFENFSVYPVSVYTNKKPIPVNPELPSGIIFKVQIGAFKTKVKENAFNGLSPLAAEKIAGSSYTRYLVGQFKTYEGVKLALSEVKTIGYKDAFVVAYRDGKRIPLYIAKTEAKQGISNYNDLAVKESTNVKERSKVSVSSSQLAENNTNNDVNNTFSKSTVKANNIKTKSKLLYTVQIGVYKKAVSHARLYNLTPIYEDVTQYGFIRYTTGIFNNISAANIEKDRIRKLGIKDAFVTAYYKGKRISITEANKLKLDNITTENAVDVTLPQVKTESLPTEKPVADISQINYKVQVGAYKTQVPLNDVKSFLSVSRTKKLVQFIDDRGYTVFAIGNYKTYQEASQMKTILINEGVADAFIVAYNGNVKISVAKAKELLGK